MIVIPESKTVPPSDAIKTNVISRLDGLQELYSEVQFYCFMLKRRPTVEAKFKSAIISFYSGIRPKVMDYINTLKDQQTKDAASVDEDDIEIYSTLINVMDNYVNEPFSFTLEEAIEVFKYLNMFCEEYGLTKTSFRREEVPY